jgi:hypothetical protein
MRLARPSDKTVVAQVVDARCGWMETKGLPSWRGARDDLVAQCDNPEGDVWVLDDEAAGGDWADCRAAAGAAVGVDRRRAR